MKATLIQRPHHRPRQPRDEIGDLLLLDGIIAERVARRFTRTEARNHRRQRPRRRARLDRPARPSPRAGTVGQGNHRQRARRPRRRADSPASSACRIPSPAIDSPSVVAWVQDKAKAEGCVNVFVTGAITKGIAGEELAPIGSLKKAGIVAHHRRRPLHPEPRSHAPRARIRAACSTSWSWTIARTTISSAKASCTKAT